MRKAFSRLELRHEYGPLMPRRFRLIVLLTILIMSGAALASDNEHGVSVRAGSRSIIFGTSGALPPLTFRLQEQSSGFAPALAQALAREMGGRAEIYSFDNYTALIDALDSGKVDYLLAVGHAPERSLQMELGTPYLTTPERIFVRRGSPLFNSLNDLTGRKVIVVEHHVSHLFLRDHGGTSLLLARTPVNALQMLIAGEGDALVHPEAVINYIAAQTRLRDQIAVTGDPIREIGFCMAARKGDNRAIERLNEAMFHLKGSGVFDKLYREWFVTNILDSLSNLEIGLGLTLLFSLAVLLGSGAVLLVRLKGLGRSVAKSEFRMQELREERSLLEKQIAVGRLSLSEANALARQESEQRIRAEGDFELFFSLSSDPICVMDLDGFFIRINQAWKDLLGYGASDLSSRRFYDLLHPEDVDSALGEVAGISGGDKLNLQDLRIIANNGGLLWMSWSFVKVEERGLLFAWGRDVTSRVTAGQVLEQRAFELKRSNEDLVQFAYVASHDLQEPLRKISSFLKLLNDRYSADLNDEAREFIAFAVDGAGRMRVMIEDLLAYSRISTKGQAFVETDMARVMRTVLSDLELAIRDSGAEIICAELPVISADPAQMGQLMLNLVGNAIKYRKPGVDPVILVEARRYGGKWEFSVSDNGIGIKPEYFERIFKVFQRLHGKGAYPGTGIGLAICQKIVERHGGRIWVESEPEKGSSFKFII